MTTNRQEWYGWCEYGFANLDGYRNMNTFEMNLKTLQESLGKLKILKGLRNNLDYEIFNSLEEVIPLDIVGKRYEFTQCVSFGEKYVKDNRYDFVSRMVETLVSSIGRGIEDYILDNSIKEKGNLEHLSQTWGQVVVSPEMGDFSKTISYRLADNEYIPMRPILCYAVIQDEMNVVMENMRYLIYGRVVLEFEDRPLKIYTLERK